MASTNMRLRPGTVAGLLLGLCGNTFAVAPAIADPVATVEVSGLSDPAERSYRSLLKGMKLFEQYHQRAPQAKLRFKLLDHVSDPGRKTITLTILGKRQPIPLALDDELAFVLPADQALADDGARVVANRLTRNLLWQAEVRTPGLPNGSRRLGDLRLECNVSIVGFVTDFPLTPANIALSLMDNPCGRSGVIYPFLSDRPLFGVTLVSGQRRQTIGSDMLFGSGMDSFVTKLVYTGKDWSFLRDRAYRLPLWDDSWPDDTLVEFEYMEDQPAAAANCKESCR